MDDSSPVDLAFDAVVDVLVQEFDSTRRDPRVTESATNPDDYVADAEEKLISHLRNRLAKATIGDKPGVTDADRPETVDTSVAQPADEAKGGHEQDPPMDGFDSGATLTLTPSARQTTDRSQTHRTNGEPEVQTPSQYEVLGQLGRGGMGIVYKARHVPLDRVVAIKMILAGQHASADALARFRQEAEAAAKLSHPNIVSLYEVGEYRGMPYFALEYIDGSPLSDLLATASLSSQRSAELLQQVARAVHHSHLQGVIHRDLKPANILITEDGIPKVADFGLAKRLDDEDGDQTRTGEILGTPGYMAPEQALGEKSIGPRTDVYALGATLYSMLTGRAPFVSPTPIETIQQVVAKDPVPPSRLQPSVDRDLETICLKCLEKDPSARYDNAAELADELQRVCEGKPILARPISRRERLVKWCRRNPRVATLSAIAGGLLLAILCGGYIAAGRINEQRIAETEARELAEANERVAIENESLAEQQATLAADATRLVLYETQKYFKYRPDLNEQRDKMLDGILPDIEKLYGNREGFNVKRMFRAATLRQLGTIYFEAGRFEQALERFYECEAIAIELHRQGRLSRPNLNFGTLDMWIGDTESKLGNLDVAERRFRSLIEHRKRYFVEHPQISSDVAKQSIVEAYGRLGEVLLEQGEIEEAKTFIQPVVESKRESYLADSNDLRARDELSRMLGKLSKLYEDSGQFQEMILASQQAFELRRLTATNNSDVPTLNNLAVALSRLGRQHQLVDDLEKAISHLRESTDQFELVLKKSPEFGEAQARAADSYYLLAKLLFISGVDHSQQCARGIELCEQLLAESRTATNRVLQLKLVALSGQVEEATKLANELAGEQYDAFASLCGAIGSSLATEHGNDLQRQELIDELEYFTTGDLPVLFELLLEAEPKQFDELFDKVATFGDDAVSKIDRELDRKLTPQWNDSRLDPNWAFPSDEVTGKIKAADGMLSERFAFCQTMPLEQFLLVVEQLRPSGYRPIRLRPYAHQDGVQIAAAWTRDRRDWRIATGESAKSIQQQDEQQRAERFVARDVAGYIDQVAGEPTELYAAIWMKQDAHKEDSRFYAGVPYKDHKTAYGALKKKGYELHHSLQGFRGLDGQLKYCGVLSMQKTGPYYLWWQQSPARFEAKDYSNIINWDIGVEKAPTSETTRERNEKALADANAKLEKNAEDLNARFARARANFYLGHDEESLADLGHVIQFSPDFDGAYFFRSILHVRLGDATAARHDMQHFADRNSSLIRRAYLDVVVSAYLDEDNGSVNRLESLIGENLADRNTLYDAACAYSLVSGLIQDRDVTKSNLYADRAVALLEQAVAAGYDNDSDMKEDAGLDPIRERDDFVQLMKKANVDLRYAGVWNQSTRFESRESHGLSPREHLVDCRTMLADGFRLVSISGASIHGDLVTASVWHRPLIPGSDKESLARRQANAAVAALRMDHADRVWPLLRHSEDPRLRTWIIHRLNPMGASPSEIVKQLDEEPDVSVRRALILIMGEYKVPTSLDRNTLSTRLLGLYRNDPDSGIRSAAEWVLRRWGRAADLPEIDKQLATGSVEGDRDWYVSKRGHTMAVIPGPVEFLMGSPNTEKDRKSYEHLHRQRIGHNFALATKEVTVGQFQEFLRQNPTVQHEYTEKYAPKESCPQISVTWYEAAAYCRWLSEQEGIVEDQMCYPAIPEIKEGLKLPSDYLSRTGYRLPSEAEWEFACRAGTTTSRYYGAANELLKQYAWFIETSGDRTWPVGRLKPNDLGLFDMQGNAKEWCQERWGTYKNLDSLSETREDTESISDVSRRFVRGGSFKDPHSNLRSAYRVSNEPDTRNFTYGFRVARTYHLSP